MEPERAPTGAVPGAVPSAVEDVGPYELSWQDGIVLVQLRCGKANALNPRTLAAIDQALDGAERGGARGVVLAERLFCHSMRPRSVSKAVRLPALLPTNARERNPRYPM